MSSVIDGGLIQLRDGRLVRLSGLDVPRMAPLAAAEQRGPIRDIALEARDILAENLENAQIRIFVSRKEDAQKNRYGHWIAHLQNIENDKWVQAILLENGLARAMPTARHPELAPAMFHAERHARKEKKGVWDLPAKTVQSLGSVRDYLHDLHVIQGRIVSVAVRQGRIYLNFGPDWRTDFTATIAPENRKAFSKRGMNPLEWGGRHVELRGWVGEYNGPNLELAHPVQIRFLQKNGDDEGAG